MKEILGLYDHWPAWYQIALRAVISFLAAVIMVRIAGRRSFGKHTPFDVVVGIILGGILSRAITGAAPFWESQLACLILVVMHRLLAMAIFYSRTIEKLVKGKTHLIVENGQIKWDSMRKNNITSQDLFLAIHKEGHTESLENVKKAYEEVSGEISIICRE